MRSSLRSHAITLALIALILVPRLIGINRFATVDEPYWLTAGSDFYYALGQRDFDNTVYDYHPAVTTMWTVTTAMLLYFPEYRGLGQGYFDVYKDSLEEFLLEHGRTPLGLLSIARALQAIVITGLLVIISIALRRLADERVAAAGVLLLSFDPFFLGHSRLLTHEAVMAALALLSMLSLLVYVLERGGARWLILSGIGAGLAQLTKSSSVIIVAVAMGLFVYGAITQRGAAWRTRVATRIRDLGVWLGVLATVYVLLWPGMWVAPGRMLHEVFGNALNYAVEGARLSAGGAAQSVAFSTRIRDTGLYVESMLWRTTPVTWLGVVLSLCGVPRADRARRIILLTLAAAGFLVVLLFGLASGRNSAHYVMLAYATLDLLAAFGIVWFAGWVAAHARLTRGTIVIAAIATAAIVGQALSALPFFPYYYNYFNPVMEGNQPGRQNPNFGFGEGLELAARYLDAKPQASGLSAMAFYGRGSFSYFFRGRTEPLKPVYADAENVPQLRQLLHRMDYLVIYYVVQNGRQVPANVMRALEGAQPERTIWLNEIEYVRIYAMEALPEGFIDRVGP